mmetsp:Transcript_2138/g.9065  ORF Transcript_2138/g.9065 Transcript_2138/m.9065 type:complete len:241 (+) Transcript_2138:164-886(+)
MLVGARPRRRAGGQRRRRRRCRRPALGVQDAVLRREDRARGHRGRRAHAMQPLRRRVRARRRRAARRVPPPLLRAVRRDLVVPAREVVPDVQGDVRRMALRRGGAVRSGRGRGRRRRIRRRRRKDSTRATVPSVAPAHRGEDAGEVGEGAGVRRERPERRVRQLRCGRGSGGGRGRRAGDARGGVARRRGGGASRRRRTRGGERRRRRRDDRGAHRPGQAPEDAVEGRRRVERSRAGYPH